MLLALAFENASGYDSTNQTDMANASNAILCALGSYVDKERIPATAPDDFRQFEIGEAMPDLGAKQED
ncbi:MAG: hypothetical protein LBV12_10010 [Puniceicoccales bacterium]|jgi:hypothetical protein|nr:hypothetical protein [Puniceicoccales bacterium]